ncbi:hypothetical protein ONZ45_g6515 [Pleurotus djamor]|nr:hypothetical protein ONZ45_g6515 [Pleurotus djamor]
MAPTNPTIGFRAFILFSIGLCTWNISRILQVDDVAEYYRGGDYPIELPVGDLDLVAMTLQETVHYSLNLADTLANEEWESVPNSVGGFGRTRLGSENRLFLVTLHHQMHCLRYIHRDLFDPSDPEAGSHHVHHCLNYLRQTILCEANESIEPGDFLERDFEADRNEGAMVCKDWGRVYDDLDARFEALKKWKAMWN